MTRMNWDTQHMAQYRTFNGTRYYKVAQVKTKKEATKQRDIWKSKMNRKARIVPVANGYDIYIT